MVAPTRLSSFSNCSPPTAVVIPAKPAFSSAARLDKSTKSPFTAASMSISKKVPTSWATASPVNKIPTALEAKLIAAPRPRAAKAANLEALEKAIVAPLAAFVLLVYV